MGFGRGDIDNLVKGTLPQHRVTKLSPREVEQTALEKLFSNSMKLY
jgi:hydroxyacid-oxoacid transhydrogenase